jgi:ribosomal protein S24E
MSEGAVTIRTKKFITNRLLQRKQFVRRAPRAQHTSAAI